MALDNPAKMADVGRRSAELDGLRGVAILLVVFAHAVQGTVPYDRGLAPSLGSLGGVAGVQLFFVLSGFLITGVLLRGGGLVRFYRRRFRRLAPTLLLVVLVVLLWTGDAWGAVRALTYTENISAGEHGSWWLSHTWSLAVEEQFYLVWPVVLLVSGRHAAKVAGVGVVATWLLQQVVWSDHAVYVGLRWDAVLAGCLLALMGWRGSRWMFAVGAAVLAVYTLGLAGPLERSDYPLVTIAAVLMVCSAHTVTELTAGWLRHLGRISYAWYLWHALAMRLDLPMPAALALGLVLAEVTYLFVDRRAQAVPLRKYSTRATPVLTPATLVIAKPA